MTSVKVKKGHFFMPTVETEDGLSSPIMSTKSDFSFRTMTSDIIHGEFCRNKEIKFKNFIKSKEFIQKIDFESIPYSEKVYTILINTALKILYKGVK